MLAARPQRVILMRGVERLVAARTRRQKPVAGALEGTAAELREGLAALAAGLEVLLPGS